MFQMRYAPNRRPTIQAILVFLGLCTVAYPAHRLTTAAIKARPTPHVKQAVP